MNWDVELAKQFKARDNKKPNGAILGDVICIEPLKISIFGDKVILTDDQCYICNQILTGFISTAYLNVNDIDSNGNMIISNSTTSDSDIEIKIKEVLKIGDKVLCLPDSTGQIFFIIDKVVK